MRPIVLALVLLGCTRQNPEQLHEYAADLGEGALVRDLAGMVARDLSSLDFAQSAGIPIGAVCNASNACVGGAVCVARIDASNGGICAQSCASDGNCQKTFVGDPRNIAHCITYKTAPTVAFCSIPCNPVWEAGPSGCAAGMFCKRYVISNLTLELTTCGDDVPLAGSTGLCDGNHDCAPGSLCEYPFFANNRCDPICRVGHDEDCLDEPSFPQCTPIGIDGMYGVCTVRT